MCIAINMNQKTYIYNSVESMGTHKHVMLVQVDKQEIRKSPNNLESYIVKHNVQFKSYNMNY